MATAYLKRYNWEPRTQLSTISNVEQVDDDTLVYYRRIERYSAPVPAWERVTVNRKDKTMVTETIARNTDGSTAVLDTSKYWSDYCDGVEQVQNKCDVFHTIAKSTRIEQYKFGIERTLSAIKFSEFEAQE